MSWNYGLYSLYYQYYDPRYPQLWYILKLDFTQIFYFFLNNKRVSVKNLVLCLVLVLLKKKNCDPVCIKKHTPDENLISLTTAY